MIRVNLDKAKAIAHEKRREARSKEFAPLDIQVTIPPMVSEAELARQAVREKYAAIQVQIDTTDSVDDLVTIVSKL